MLLRFLRRRNLIFHEISCQRVKKSGYCPTKSLFYKEGYELRRFCSCFLYTSIYKMHVVTDFGEWLNEVMLKIGVTLFAMLYVTPFS